MSGGELLVILLSAVPIIENRGAMFIGFALGITDPVVYAAGTLLNIVSIPFWSAIIRKIPLPLKRIKAKPLAHLPILITLPYNGVNMASVLYFERAFSATLTEIFPYLSLGIIFRGIVTYLFLVGLLGFMSIYQAITILVLWFALHRLWQSLDGKKRSQSLFLRSRSSSQHK
ncbi:MAG: hypothetical protein NT051_00845 [Candidatus Micrarchaeota archaeon]|nr:hypothetical protein [Candidatus Micrarchaeota archaeon]